MPVPDEPFPHENETATIQKVHRVFDIGGKAIIAVKVGIVAAGVALGVRWWRDRKSVVKGKSESVRVDLGGRRSIKQKQFYFSSTNNLSHSTPYIYHSHT